MIQGSSVDPAIVARVHAIAKDYPWVPVCLDSNHPHVQGQDELEASATALG